MQATLSELTAITIAHQVQLNDGCDRLLVCGGSPANLTTNQCGTLPLTVTLDNAKQQVSFTVTTAPTWFWSKGNGAFVEHND